MTREEMDQVAKEIHECFIRRSVNYFEAMCILDILKNQYEKKINYNTENMLVSEIAKIKIPRGKDLLI